MCGIVGIFSKYDPISPEALSLGASRLNHRGPDGRRQWVAPHRRIGLGHSRLSIIDLDKGDQPIANEDEQLHIIANGEFYDFERIRQQLKERGHHFRTNTDSEIALHLYEDFGTECLRYLRGEFAFMLWDEPGQQLFAARDRFGIKPLYYAMVSDTLYLASEAKALFEMGVAARWDHESVFQQLFICVNQDRTLFEGIYQLPPGHYLLATRCGIQIVRYWDLNYPRIDVSVKRHTDGEYIEQLRSVLDEAIRIRLRADVPVGCFLSGGVDSSAVLGIAAKHSSEPIRAFTVSFDQEAYDEGPIARQTASHVGAHFNSIPLTQSDYADHIADTIWHAETVGINLHGVARYIQSRATHEAGYKVVLSGEGSDEIFAGYSHARQDLLFASKDRNSTPSSLSTIEQKLGFVPHWLKKIAVARSFFHVLFASDYAAKFEDCDVYGKFLSNFDIDGQVAGREPVIQSLYLWNRAILPNYTLFSERLEMAHAVEVRLPFLDHYVFDLVREMPVNLLINGTKEKYVLREAARPFLLDKVYSRPKQPFIAPPAVTANNRLHALIEDSLRSQAMASIPFFDHDMLISLLDDLPSMNESKTISLEAILMMTLSIYFLHTRYNL